MKSIYFILVSIILLYAFSSSTTSNQKRQPIKGKWYSSYGNTYTSVEKRGILARCYRFNGISKISFSSCTDMCGCMKVTYIGTYNWINDSTISVVYNRTKRRGQVIADFMKEKERKRLRVSRKNKKSLIIREIKSKH